MAPSPEPTHASHGGEVRRPASSTPSAHTKDHDTDLGTELTQKVNQRNLLTQILSDPSSSYNYTDIVRFRQPSASNRSEDVFVHVEASSQSGPCHDNVLAIHHDCMELDELDLMIEAQLRGALGEMMFTALDPQQQQSNLFAEIIGDIVDLLGPFSPNLKAIFVGDTGESLGSIFFVTN